MSKDRGWKFLNSEHAGFLDGDEGDSYIYSDGSGYYHGADGSEGYIYSDGSGYYHGADGSDGHLYSDGSGYYHGSDGSDGYLYSDGSGYYHGADGSNGYKYSDGSGYYNRADGSSYSLESAYNDNGNNYDEDSGSVLGSLIGLGIAGLAIHAANKESERAREEERRQQWEAEEKIRKEKAKENRTKRITFYKKHWKGIVILIVVLSLVCFGGYVYYQYQRSIPVGISSENLVGQYYEEAVSALEKAGFTDVSSSPIYDIGVEDINIEGTVESVSIDGQTSFTKDKRFQFDAQVTVSYHKIKDINIPLSSKEAKKLQYEDLVNKLKDAGFINITLEPEFDLIKGWLKKEGRVDSVTINGDSSFEADTAYRPDAEIIIVYHALKRDKEE